jgi:hypothetical protein
VGAGEFEEGEVTGLFYISFATDAGFRGATVVEAANEANAVIVASRLGLNPGGEAAVLAIPADAGARELAEILSYKNRLVGKDELVANGARKLRDLPGNMQAAIADAATVVCEDCNRG